MATHSPCPRFGRPQIYESFFLCDKSARMFYKIRQTTSTIDSLDILVVLSQRAVGRVYGPCLSPGPSLRFQGSCIKLNQHHWHQQPDFVMVMKSFDVLFLQALHFGGWKYLLLSAERRRQRGSTKTRLAEKIRWRPGCVNLFSCCVLFGFFQGSGFIFRFRGCSSADTQRLCRPQFNKLLP